MSTSLTFDEHLAAIAEAGARLTDLARVAGDDAPVVTCPKWNVRTLVAHQAMVHRWATANITGADPAAVPTATEISKGVDDLGGYYLRGLDKLLQALEGAPADLDAAVFLNDAPPAREFWARRQAHETTIHMVDALSAVLDRVPTTEEVAVDHSLALDGIDEILAGFFTRGRSKLYDGKEMRIVFDPTDSARRWYVDAAEKFKIAVEPISEPDATIEGTAAGIYLGLWNRGNDLEAKGDAQFIERWRSAQKVRWR